MTRSRRTRSPGPQALLSYLIPLLFVALAVADFARDGQVDKFLIGALLIFGLGALGWRLDDIVGQRVAERVQDALSSAAGGGNEDEPSTPTLESGGPDANAVDSKPKRGKEQSDDR